MLAVGGAFRHHRTCLQDTLACVQVRTAYETDLAEVCAPRQANVGLLAYSPLAGGALSGKYTDKAPEGARFTIFPGGYPTRRSSPAERGHPAGLDDCSTVTAVSLYA